MNTEPVFDQDFSSVDFTVESLHKEYEGCTFINCSFAGLDLTFCSFVECEFVECDFSNAKLTGVSFKEALFKKSKLQGLRFENCNPFLLSFSFDDCNLNFSSFYKMNLKKTSFKNCQLQQVDFVEANLAEAILELCDLLDAAFENTILDRADLRTSYNFSINPEQNQIKKAKFSKDNLAGLLLNYEIVIN